MTIGSGTAAGCSESAFLSALASAKEIKFNCGALPVTITLGNAKVIASDLTIDGGNKVTLSTSAPQAHFGVQSGAHLTLTKLSLINGANTGCGGAVYVNGNARLTLSSTRFFNNRSGGNGGALCVQAGGSAEIYASQFAGNSAETGNGGAIYNAGSVEMYWSDVSGNSTSGHGGGILNSGSLDVSYSLVGGNSANNNSASAEGGGIYNFGEASLSASTVSGNFANYGGGISHNGTGLYLTGVTVASNSADPGPDAGVGRFLVAGGLNLPGGAVTMRNTLLAGNWPGNCRSGGIALDWLTEGNNLDSQDRCKIRGPGDLVNADPKLGSLRNNGGSTRTQTLAGGSPAIDAGNDLYCGFFDQRGFSGPPPANDIGLRGVDGNSDGLAVCDIGAFEYRPQVFVPLVFK